MNMQIHSQYVHWKLQFSTSHLCTVNLHSRPCTASKVVVISHNTATLLRLKFEVSTEKLSRYQQFNVRTAPSVKLCGYIILHDERSNPKKHF